MNWSSLSWLSPTLAAIAAAIAVPSLVILYFLKLRRRELEVSTTLLWKKAIQDLQANAPFQKLRRNILLILQLLMLAAALVGVAQPMFQGQAPETERHIILIDRSASMSATDGEPERMTSDPVTRLDAAKKKAIELVESLREPGLFRKDGGGDQAMVISFDTTAEVRQQYTGDKNLLKAAINGITATDAPTKLGEAMRLAKAQAQKRILKDTTSGQVYELEGLETAPKSTIHLYSDGRLPDAGENKPLKEDEVEFVRIGTADAANLAITGLRSERAFDQPSQLSIFVGLQSTWGQVRKVDVELSIDGVVAGIKSVDVPGAGVAVIQPVEGGDAGAGGAAPLPGSGDRRPGVGGVVFTLDRAEGGLVRVRLMNMDGDPSAGPDQRDTLDADNRAWLVVPPARRLAVALVTKGNYFLKNALTALPLSKSEVLTPEEFEKLPAAKLGEFDVVMLDGWLPDGAGAVGLPPGRYVIFNAVPTGAGLIDKGTGPGSVMLDWDRRHPVTKDLELDAVTIATSRVVELVPRSAAVSDADRAKADAMGAGSAIVLAACDQGPAILETGGKDWRAVVVPFDIAASTWPFEVSFVLFCASAVEYAGGGQGDSLPAQLVQPGSVLTDRLPIGASDATIAPPSGGSERLIAAADGKIVFGPIRTHGVYQVTWSGPAGPSDGSQGARAVRSYAANLLDPAESNLGAVDQVDFSSRRVSAAAAGGAKSTVRLWPYLLMGALALVMIEWFVYNRKVHV